MPSDTSPPNPRFFGVWVVRAAFVLALFGWGVGFYGPPIFLHAVSVRTGWPLTTVSPWYVRSRPVALAKAYNGASIGGVIFMPLWVALMSRYGFAHATVIVGTLMTLVLALLARFVFARSPASMHQQPDGAAASSPPAPVSASAALPGALLLIGVVLFGLGIGNATSFPPLVAQTDFAPQDVPRVVALIVAMGQGTYAFAPALFGVVLALSGAGGGLGVGERSTVFFAIAASLQLVAGAVFLAGRRGG